MFDPYLIVIIIQVLLLITLLVGAHELGHYLFARLFGMGVEEFALGFGKKPLFTWLRKTYRVDSRQDTAAPSGAGTVGEVHLTGPQTETTNFTVRPWPLGGFVRIKGMIPEEDGSEVNIPGGFYSKAPWQRFVVLLMGPVFSILAGFAILIPLFISHGIEKPWNVPMIDYMMEGGPAKQAGLQKGDQILTVDGERVATFYDVLSRIRDRGVEPVALGIERQGERLNLTVTPVLDESPSPVRGPDLEPTSETRIQSKLGIGVPTRKVPLSFSEATLRAVELPVRMVASLFGAVAQPSRLKEEVGGPIAIATIAGATAREGMSTFLMFGGALSISLGIFNLLPIAPLDGGQMVVAFVEMLRRGRRLSFRIQNWVAGMGVFLMAVLIISVFWLDISRTLGAGKASKNSTAPNSKTSTAPQAR